VIIVYRWSGTGINLLTISPVILLSKPYKGVDNVTFFRKRPYLLLILPAFILYTIFIIYPVISAIPYSFTKWSGLGPKTYVGLQNYKMLFEHPVLSQQALNAVHHHIYLIILAMIFLVPFVVFLAYVIYKEIPLYKYFKIVILLPYFINPVALGFLATLFFNPNIGLLPNIGNIIGIKINTSTLFSNVNYVIPVVLVVSAWNSMGYSMLIALANFVMVPSALIEASIIDGAGEWKRFRYVYIPLIRPGLVNIIIIHYIWAMTIFEVPYVLAGGSSGGVGGAMDFLLLFYYRTTFGGYYINNSMGLGTAIAVSISLVVLVGSVIMIGFINRKRVEYY
jgi:raffinose/stachyose/melibiose transport system permease protein